MVSRWMTAATLSVSRRKLREAIAAQISVAIGIPLEAEINKAMSEISGQKLDVIVYPEERNPSRLAFSFITVVA